MQLTILSSVLVNLAPTYSIAPAFRAVYPPGTGAASFAATQGVPTILPENSYDPLSTSQPPHASLHRVENTHAYSIDAALSRDECESLIALAEDAGIRTFNAGKNVHGALQVMVPPALLASLESRILPHAPVGGHFLPLRPLIFPNLQYSVRLRPQLPTPRLPLRSFRQRDVFPTRRLRLSVQRDICRRPKLALRCPRRFARVTRNGPTILKRRF